jgi:hypothetical protein
MPTHRDVFLKALGAATPLLKGHLDYVENNRVCNCD